MVGAEGSCEAHARVGLPGTRLAVAVPACWVACACVQLLYVARDSFILLCFKSSTRSFIISTVAVAACCCCCRRPMYACTHPKICTHARMSDWVAV